MFGPDSNSSASLCYSYGDRVEHFRVLEGGGQYSIWDESFCSLNRLVDYYRSHSIAVEKVIRLRDPPPSPRRARPPACNPYPNPYRSCSQESLPSAHHRTRDRTSSRLFEAVVGVRRSPLWRFDTLPCLALLCSAWHPLLSPPPRSPSLPPCRGPAWLTPSATTCPRRSPTSTSAAATSSTCWTAPARCAGGGAAEAEWGSSRRSTCSRSTTDGDISNAGEAASPSLPLRISCPAPLSSTDCYQSSSSADVWGNAEEKCHASFTGT